jgi:pimeloyl-ACP methyl ester carboxylesterase
MFAHWELRRDDPMLDLRLFRHRGFSAGSSTLAILFFAMAGAVFLQAQYLQFVLDYTPLAAGTALVPAAIGMVLGTGAGAHLADRFGGRLAVVTGTLLAAGGIAAQAALVDGTGYVPTGVGLFLFGLGAGVAMPAATELIMATLPPARAGVGSAVNDTVREVGGALGVAVIGSVAAAAYAANLDDIPDVSMLPDGVQAAVTDNVGAALHVSHRLGADGARLADAARQAFVDAMTGSLWIAAGVALSASVIAFFHLPRQAEDAHEVAELPGNRPRVHAAVMLAVAVGVAVLLTACGADPKPAAQASPPSTTVAAVERPTAPVDRMVRTIDGGMHLRCVGEGDTTVLLIAGWGAAGDGWGRIEPTIRERARVCSYDRYGTGASDAPPSSQTFADQAADLEALLRTAGEPGPYVVLGHSFGGAEAVTFAAQRPAHVTGLVLLDASPVTWPSAVCAVPDDGTDTAAEFRLTCDQMRHPAHNAEHLDAVDAFDEVAEIDSLGVLPLIVVTASQRTFPGLAADQLARLNGVWNDGVDRWASLSTASTVVSVDDTGHDIQLDQPQVVIDQIEALLP